MTLIQHRPALQRIAQDKFRNLIADHGASLVSVPRRLSALGGSRSRYLNLLMLEHRLSLDGRLTPLIRRHLPEILGRMHELVGPCEEHLALKEDGFRAIVLRMPEWHGEEVRKGVLLIKFGETFRFFFHHIDIARLMRFFSIVLEPSWSGYCLPEVLLWANYSDPVIVQSSEVLDRDFLRALGTNLVPIEIGASDWVDHRVFQPQHVPKIFDAIYVANLTPIKRVNVYLRAISRIARSRPGFRAAIALASWGGDQAAFEDMVRYYGVGEQLQVFMRVPQARLNDLINQSRVSVLLSRKEGSNKTLFESLFAGTPGILLKNNIGVNKEYINEHTGRLIDEAELADVMLGFADGTAGKFTPREWVMQHIAPEHSTRKLQEKLAEHAPGATAPLFVKVNTPEATYMDASVEARMPNITAVLRLFLKTAVSGVSDQSTGQQLRALFEPARQAFAAVAAAGKA